MNQPNIGDYIYLFPASSEERLRRCQELESNGPIGRLASMLYRTINASMLADLHDSVVPIFTPPHGDHPRIILERILHEIDLLLCGSPDYKFIQWGWKQDDRCPESPWVMAIELPTGNFQCWVPNRGTGPSYDRALICSKINIKSVSLFCENVLYGYYHRREEW